MSVNLNEVAAEIYAQRREAVENGEYDLEGDDHSLTDGEQELVDKLETNGFTFLGYGAARIVVRDGDTVLKFARYGADDFVLEGTRQNEYELRIADEYDCDVLNEPLESGDGNLWVRYPYRTPLPEAEISGDTMTVLIYVRKQIRESVPELNAFEIDHENIGVGENNAYVIDYGIPMPPDET